MPNYCPSCGANLDESYKFCLSCGVKLDISGSNNKKDTNRNEEPSNAPAAPNSQENIAPSTQSRKSNKVLLMTIIAIIAILIIIVVVVFVFNGDGVIDSRFIGEWEQTDGEFMKIDWTFKSDGSLEIMSMDLASWIVKGNQLCFNTNEFWDDFMPEGSLDEVCYDFEFSNGGNTVTLSIDGSENTILNRK